MRNKITSLGVAIVGLVAWTALTLPAGAQPGLNQTDSLTVQLPVVQDQEIEVCLNGTCQTVPLGGSGNHLQIALSYTINPSSDLPNVDASGPIPDACTLPDGRKRAGAAITITGAKFASGSTGSLAVRANGEEKGRVDAPPASHDTGDVLVASACLVTVPQI